MTEKNDAVVMPPAYVDEVKAMVADFNDISHARYKLSDLDDSCFFTAITTALISVLSMHIKAGTSNKAHFDTYARAVYEGVLDAYEHLYKADDK